MIDVKGPFRVGAFLVGISGLLHILAVIIGAFSAEAILLVPVGLLYLAFCYGLLRGWRWLAHVVFIVMLIGIVAALSSAFGPSSIPGWWWLSIVLVDFCAAVALFGALWRAPQST